PGGGLVTDATSTESPSTLNVGPPPRPTLFPYTTLFRSVSQGSHQVVVDLEGVDFLDSTGLGVLVGGLKRLRSHDGDMILVCTQPDRKSTRLNSSHRTISYAVFCLKKKTPTRAPRHRVRD